MAEATLIDMDETQLARLAACLALKLHRGQAITLAGDLGMGKTTFARAFIRAAMADPQAEVPSPTFAIEQLYETPRGAIAHYDFYRLADAGDLGEIGFEDRAADAVTLIEWPERAEAILPADRVEIAFSSGSAPSRRHLALTGHGSAVAGLQRAVALFHFLERLVDWHGAGLVHLQGDASTRSYARLIGAERTAVIMDAPEQPDGPPARNGKPYSRIAHLAEDVRPFVAVAQALRAAGIAAPAVYASELAQGFLLLEDFGDLSFGNALAAGYAQSDLWTAAVDTLLALRASPPAARIALPDGRHHTLPRFDRQALEIELELILDWYWPAVKAEPASDRIRAEFRALWAPHVDRMLGAPPGLFLRDYHSPNLFWRPGETGLARVGVIDFQDALAESWSYDLASLLQDARITVPAELEAREFARYVATMADRDPSFDHAAFFREYATFGAQRNTRLVGLWVRLLRRDAKPQYLAHMPRTWNYLARNLAHPALADVRAFYDRHFPQDVRNRSLAG
jgi:hypothetical protein